MSDRDIDQLIENNPNPYEFKFQQYLIKGFKICNEFVTGFILFFFLYILISGSVDLISDIGDLVNRFFVTPIIGTGVYFVARNISEKKEFNFDQFWKGFQFVTPLILMTLIETAIFLLILSPILINGDINLYLEWYEEWQKTPLGMNSFPDFQIWFLFLLIPILYLSIVWIYAPLLIIFYNMPAWDAMETSRKIISKQWLDTFIELKDVSTGGLRIESAKEEFKKGTPCEIVLPKIKDLDGKKLKCEVSRASFIEANWVHDIGLRFIPPNTDYLKQFVEIIERHYIK